MEFNTEINPVLAASRDPISEAVGTLFGGSIATLVDVGASIWNTLPGDEVDTEEILSRIGGDPLRVYQESPDAVHAASLIGGSFIPGGGALKGMNLLRNAARAPKWFSAAGKVARTEEMANLMRAGKAGTQEYKNALWANRGNQVVNNTLDAAATELAMLGTMQAHPLLEDYWKDPVQNFGISLLIGGGLGAVGGLIVDNAAIRKVTGEIERTALQKVYDAVRPVSPAMPDATALQTHAITISNLEEMIQKGAKAGKIAENDLEMSVAVKFRKELEVKNGQLLDNMLSPELRALPQIEKNALLQKFSTDSAMHGVQSVRALEAKEILDTYKQKHQTLNDVPILKEVDAKGETKSVAAVYFADIGKYGSMSDVPHHAGVAALGKSVDELEKLKTPKDSKTPNFDSSFEHKAKSTAAIEGDYAAWTLKFAKMPDDKFTEHLRTALISSNDVAQVQAIATRLAIAPPEVQASARVRVAEKALGKGVTPKEANLADLYQLTRDNKFSLIKGMFNEGYSFDVIAKRVNMTSDQIEAFAASDRTLDAMNNLDIIKFKTADNVKEALSVKNMPLVLKGSLKKADYTQGHANLNTSQLQQINQLIIGKQLAQSKSPAAQRLHQLIFQEMGNPLAILRSKLGMLNNELAGNSFLGSSDFVYRRMEDLGPVITQMGRSMTEIANQTESRLVKPLSDALVGIGNDIAALTELNTGYQLYNSLKGARFYKDRQFWQLVDGLDAAGNPAQIMQPVAFNGKEFRVVSDSVDTFFTEAGKVGKELLEMSRTAERITGAAGRSDLGYWLPSMSPINKHIAYLHDRATDTTRMIYGKTSEELESGINAFTEEIAKSNGNLFVVRKGDQTWWNYTNGRSGSIYMQTVDATKLKTGSAASAIVPVNRDVMSELINGYQHYINASVRNLAELSLSDVIDNLRRYSSFATGGIEAQPLGFIKRVTQRKKDIASDTINTLLGNPLLRDHEGWTTASQTFDAALTKGAQVASSVWRTMTSALPKKLTAEHLKDFSYEDYVKKLEAAGVVNPFEHFDNATAQQLFAKSRLTENPDISKRLIAASNGLVSTMALRFGEIAHPLVNLMSMPIMTTLANSRKMPERFLGAQRGTAEVSTMRVMYEGIRSMHSPRFAALNRKWEANGYFKPLVSEATEAMQDARKFETGAIARVERALNSGFVNVMSKGADYSEALSRKITMHTGYQLGKRLYPELSDEGLTIFARDFMDKALGNYSASQRPVMFQGTMGMALGLFQTYMLTMAQNVYRNVELRDWKTLAKGMLAQNTIFGFHSMPGFEPVSNAIGEHFSDEHFDLTTGTYRAVGGAADWILYGLPSNLLQSSLSSRGSIDPNFPNLAAGFDNLAAYNILAQSGQLVHNIARATGRGEDAGQALLQAFSLQSMSRPIARLSEIGMALTGEGGSINQAGNTVSTSEEVLTTTGIFARVLATRPLQEDALRQAQRLNRFYEAADKDNREVAINDLRTAIRNGTNTPDKIAEIAEKYMRNGGSPVGWRAAYRNALMKTNTPGQDTFIDSIDETNPLNYMMDELE